MAVVQPFVSQWRQYLSNQDGSTSFNAGWIDTRKCRELVAHVSWTAIAATAGTLALQGSEDDSLSSTTAVTLTATVTHGAQPTGGTAGSLILVVEYIPSFVRLIYTRTGGGGANQFTAWIMGRAT